MHGRAQATSRNFRQSSPVMFESLEHRRLMAAAPPSQAFWAGFGGDAQHQSIAAAPLQNLEAIHWQTKVDLDPQYSGESLLIHYGSPVITAKNTVIVPIKTTATGGFQVWAIDGATGHVRWKFASDYVAPTEGWSPSFSPVLTSTGRLYMPGAGGTVIYIDNVNSATRGAAHQVAFYGQATWSANKAAYKNSVLINTPLTVSKTGNVFFGYQVVGDNPLHLKGGIGRMNSLGQGKYRFATDATGDAVTNKVAQGSAPALSPNEKIVYATMNPTETFGQPSQGSYLVALDSTSLQTVGKVKLKDPSTGDNAAVFDGSTASPTVGPDGDVYFGVLESSFGSNHGRGWLLHFNSSLTISKTPGLFGWDDTVSIVPAALVTSYHGASSYLLASKYNNYASLGGDGINKLAILDPSATQTDASGVAVMKEVETIAGVIPDPEATDAHPGAVKEWCVNVIAIDLSTRSAIVNSEDGRVYRWNLATNKLTQIVRLTAGLGEAYTPTAIGPDGTGYAIQDGILFAVGKKR